MLTETAWNLFFFLLEPGGSTFHSKLVGFLIFCIHIVLFNPWKFCSCLSADKTKWICCLSIFLMWYHSSMIIFLPFSSAFSWLFNSTKRTFFFFFNYLKALQSCAFGGNLLQVNLPYLLGKYIAECPISSCLSLTYNCIQSFSCSQLYLLLLIHSITMFFILISLSQRKSLDFIGLFNFSFFMLVLVLQLLSILKNLCIHDHRWTYLLSWIKAAV